MMDLFKEKKGSNRIYWENKGIRRQAFHRGWKRKRCKRMKNLSISKKFYWNQG